ncbi:MAG: metal-dependent transcriptional regulator [Candidatus Omnitrophica bacterium]|nr:metal-dependent transcriptional regulator [Candidatus Omnitrophota bacterium]
MRRRDVSAQGISAAQEDYLETIAFLQRERGAARVSAIGRFLRVKNPTVSATLRVLDRRGLVAHRPYGAVELTPAGVAIAAAVQQRHDLLVGFFRDVLGVPAAVAEADACTIEHGLSVETFSRMQRFVRRQLSKARRA